MNDELTTQSVPPPIVLKLKKFDDHYPTVTLPHTSHLTAEPIDDEKSNSSLFVQNNQSPSVTTTSPSTLLVKLKKSFFNGNVDHSDEEFITSISSENLTRPTKRSKKSSSNDNISNSDFNNDQMSSQQEKQTIDTKQDHSTTNEQPSPSLVLKIRRDSLTTTNSSIGILSTTETENNRHLLLKLKKNENGELITSTQSIDSSMSTEFLINEQQICSTSTEISSTIAHTNGHNDSLYKSTTSQSTSVPHITNVLSNFNNNATTTTHNNNIGIIQKPTTTSSLDQTSETHTKDLLDEALDSVKNVLMQTFKKNLESGGDLNALKNTLSSEEVAEAFLSKLKQSLKRDTENESKSHENHTDTDTHLSQIPTTPSSSSSNPLISPVMNVVSSPSSSPLLPPMSSLLNKNSLPSSPQPQTTVGNNNKRKASASLANPNRFDGTSEEELTKRVLSDILQPNLDIVFVGINPSLYAVHKGHHYGGPGNHFWKLLHMSGLIPNVFNANDDYRMPQYGIGFTNIVQRPTKAGSDITKDEITLGAEVLVQKIKMYRPRIVAFNGRGIYEVYAGNKHFHYGKQPDLFPETETHVFVMPSSSARCSQLPRAEDKLPFYVGLKKLRDFVNGTLHSLNEAEITFPDIKIKDTDDVLQKTVIRISNKPFSELSAETLKPYGDKIPSGQMISKHVPPPSSQKTNRSTPSPSSSSNLVFNTDAITTQTLSILHNTSHQQNGSLLTYDQQAQRVYLQNDGNYTLSSPPPSVVQSPINYQQRSANNSVSSLKASLLENSTSNTNAAVLAALANGGYNSSSSQLQQTFYQSTQTTFIGGQQQTITYSIPSTLNNNSTIVNSRLSSISSTQTPSYVIPHPPQISSLDHQNSSSTSTSHILPRQLVVINSSESLPSFDTILNSSSLAVRTQQIPSKDSISSQQSIPKQTLIVVAPTVKSTTTSTNSSTINQPKLTNSNPIEKRPLNTTDDCLYVRYEREPTSSTNDQFRFSYIIDEHSPSLHKRLRYVSINDL